MKKCLLFFCFAFSISSLVAQTKTWNGANGAPWSVGTNWLPNGVPASGDTVIFNSANACEVDVNPTIASLRATGAGGNLISSTTTRLITIDNNGAASPVLNVASGSFLSLGNGGFGISFSTYGNGGPNNAQIKGTLFLGFASAWIVNNAGQTNITNVDITGTIRPITVHTGAVLTNSSIATVRFLNGSTLDWNRDGGNIPDADYQNGSTINVHTITNTMVTFSGSSNYNGLVIWNCTTQSVLLSGAAAVLLPTTSYAMDSIRVVSTGSGSLRLATEAAGYTISSLEVQGGTLEMSSPVVANSFASVTTELKVDGGTVIGNATYTGDAVAAFGTTLTVGKLTVSSGTLNLTNRPVVAGSAGGCKLYASGDLTQTGGTVTATNLFALFTNVLGLSGTLPQNLTMTTFSGPITFDINNSSVAGITLLSNFTIPASPAALVFTSGVLTTTSSNLLILAAGATVSGASNAGFVDGPVRKIGNTVFTFPIGKTTCGPSGNVKGYAALGIANFTGGAVTDQYTAEYKRGNSLALGTINAIGLNHISLCDYWTLTRDLGVSTVDITLAWSDPINNCVITSPYVDNLPSLTIAHNDNSGGNWDAYGVVGTYSGTNATGTVTWTGVQSSAFGAFTIGSIDFLNPLPINLNYLNGIKQGNNNYLSWKVTCNNNPSATMVLERSADGNSFTESVISITADALRCQQPFDYTDTHPLSGINYYRLKMIDANGKITYSSKVALLNKATGFEIVGLYPTVVSSNAILNVTAAQQTKMDVLITDVTGRQVQKIAYNLIAGSNQFTLNLANLSAGTYQITGYSQDGISKTIRFVKQ